MSNKLILQQHIPFADIIITALDFAKSMLSHSKRLYPFAVVAEANQVTCVFTPDTAQTARECMIEELQQQIDVRNQRHQHLTSILVYAASIQHPNKGDSDALVFNISDAQGQNTVTVYPFKHTQSGILIYPPYSCDFFD